MVIQRSDAGQGYGGVGAGRGIGATIQVHWQCVRNTVTSYTIVHAMTSRLVRSAPWRAGLLVAMSAAAVAAQAPDGRLVADTVHSRAIEKNLYGDSPDRSVLVYLPPSYESGSGKRYPVVYLLHGFGGTETV